MKSYLNNPTLKADRIAIMKAHQAADELVRGATEGRRNDGTFRGCAVVCTIGSYSHAAYETELGIPRQLARIEDGIFESLPIERAMQWPLEFLEAVPVGANLLISYWQFMEWLLVDPQDGVIRFAKTQRTKGSIIRVAGLYQSRLKGETPAAADAYAAAAAYAAYAADAYAAAAADAYAADAYAAAAAYAADAAAAAAYAAYAADAYAAAADAYAADAYAAAAAYAAYAADAAAYAADAAARNSSRLTARVRQADKLLELLRAAPQAV